MLQGTTTSAEDARPAPFSGSITVEEDGSVRGTCADGPIVAGELRSGHLTFDVLYNAALVFRYELSIADGDSGAAAGPWSLVDSPNAELPHNHGAAQFTVTRKTDGAALAANREAADREALPSAGEAGNEACKVSHNKSVAVPCTMCGEHGPDSRLAFFDISIPVGLPYV